VSGNADTCTSTPGDPAGIYRSGRGVSVVNNSVPSETFGRTDANHDTPGPNGTLIQDNLINSNINDGIYIKLTTNTAIQNNRITQNTGNGILWVGSTGGSIQGNTVDSNGLHGLRVEPHYGSSTSPATASDDHLNGALAVGTTSANAFNNNNGSGVYIIDDDIGYTAAQINAANTFSGNTNNRVQQDWLGVVEILQGSGSTWNTITSGQTVTIAASGGGLTWSESTYDATAADSARGVWGPSGLNYDDVDTWFYITEEVVDNAGALHTYSPHTVSTTGGLTGSKTFSYDGNSTTDPVSPDYGLAFSNDTASTSTGRYQIAELRFTPTTVTLVSVEARRAAPGREIIVVVGILLLLGALCLRQRRRAGHAS